MELNKRKMLISALTWPNLAVGLVVLVLALTRQIHDTRALLRTLAYALVYANSVSLFGTLVIGLLATRLSPGKLPLVRIFALCILVIVPLGCLLIQALLVLLGVEGRQNFWPSYFANMRVSLPLATVFALGAFVHSSLRGRLEITEARLQQKELDEQRARQHAVEARLRSLESRIHPHFLFNTLNTISSLIAVNPARAEEIVGRLATLLRTSLDTSDRPLIPLREELQIVHSYLEIETARFGDKLRASLDVAPGLQDTPVPPMSVQTLVENAVKHGITSQPGGGDIRVTASAENASLRIEVSDSGPGFELSAVPADHGLDNLVERLQALFADHARLNASRRDGRCIVEMVVPRS
jgi:sensor histidine kinase YesM